MMTFGEKVLRFNNELRFDRSLPEGIAVMNPFKNNPCALAATRAFYDKYYADDNERSMILGINPGRFGAGYTGVPFTDTKRLAQYCDIAFADCMATHEPSSEFVYEVIAAYGGPRLFYGQWYINSVCPLGFTKKGKNGKPVNYNYYDSSQLTNAALPFIIKTLREQLSFGIIRTKCICFGTGKNANFLESLNEKYHFFDSIIPLEHPRYIMQYKNSERHKYIEKYLVALGCN